MLAPTPTQAPGEWGTFGRPACTESSSLAGTQAAAKPTTNMMILFIWVGGGGAQAPDSGTGHRHRLGYRHLENLKGCNIGPSNSCACTAEQLARPCLRACSLLEHEFEHMEVVRLYKRCHDSARVDENVSYASHTTSYMKRRCFL
jgi:hypothetical protein